MPPSTATNVGSPRLTVTTLYSVIPARATTLRPGSTRIRACAGRYVRAASVSACSHSRGVGAMLVVGVAHAEAAAEVVDVELPHLRDDLRPPGRTARYRGSESRCERAGHRARADRLRGPARSPPRRRHARDRTSSRPVRSRSPRAYRDGHRAEAGSEPAGPPEPSARGDRCRHGCRSRCGPTPASTAILSSASVFAFPCSTMFAGSTPGVQRDDKLSPTGDVEPESLLRHQREHGRARIGLRREHHLRVRPPLGERIPEGLAHVRAQAALVDDVGGRPEGLRHIVQPAARRSSAARQRRVSSRPGTARAVARRSVS